MNNISVSQTKSKNNPKVYTYGFKSVEVKDLDHLADLANTYSISVATYKNNHRANENVLEGGSYILIDCDEEGQAQRVQAKIQHYDYVKVPSQSTLNYNYKYHFILPTQIPLATVPSAMEYQVRRFFNQVGITDEDIDTTGSYDRVRQFAPSVVDKYSVNKGVDTYTYGLTIEEATDLTEVLETGLQVPLVSDIPEIYTEHGIKSCRPKRKLNTVDGDVNDITDIKDNILDRSKAVYFNGKKVSLDDAEVMVFEAIDKSGNNIVSGFGCPCCNTAHSYDYTTGYGYAFIDNVSGAMTIKCTGNQCKDNPLYVLPIKTDSDIVFTEVDITTEDISISNTFKTRWETKLNCISNANLEDNWKQNFSAFRQVIERNKANKSAIKIICPSPTGSGKSQQIVHQAINLYQTDVRTLIIVLRTEDADILAKQIQDLTSSDYVAVHHSKEVTQDVKKDRNSQCLIITHSMFLGHKDMVNNRDFIVIDEAIDAVNHLSVYVEDLGQMLYAFKKHGVNNECTDAIAGIHKAMDKIGKSLKNNKHHQMFGDNGFEFSIPEPTQDMYDAINDKNIDFIKVASKRANGSDIQNQAIRGVLLNILDNLHHIFDNWCYVSNTANSISLNTAMEIIPDKSVVIMDATATVNSLYKLYSRYKQNLTVLPKVECRNYSNVNLYTTKHCNTGRSSILNDTKFLESFVDTINKNTTAEDKVLVVTFKDIEPNLQSYFNEDTIKVDHWNNLTGTNKYDECNKVFIFGLNHKPKEVILNKHVLSKGSNRTFLDNEDNTKELYQITVSDLSSEVIQAINRIRCRKPVDNQGSCLPCDIYLTLPVINDQAYVMKQYIRNEMSGINIDTFSLTVGTDTQRERYSLTERYLQQLEYLCDKDTMSEGVHHDDVLYTLDISPEQYRKHIKDKKLFKDIIESDYITYYKPRIDRRGRPKKTKDTYYYKK